MEKIETIDMKRIKEFEGIDFETGEPLVVAILNLYLGIAPKLLKEIISNAEVCNIEKLHQATHSLKSSSANIGADKLSRLCKDLELKTEPGSGVSEDLLRNIVEQIAIEYPKVSRDVGLIMQLTHSL